MQTTNKTTRATKAATTKAATKAAPAKAAPAKAAKAKPDAEAQAAKAAERQAATISRGLARDASTVTRGATNFEQYSDRDTAYLTFFGNVMRRNGGSATLAQIHEAGTDAGGNKRRNPNYNGSAKATDAGAINRLIKAGYITASADGRTLTVTDAGKSQAAYNGKA